MLISLVLHPLLSQFTIEVTSGMWWVIVSDYVQGESPAELDLVADQLDELAAVHGTEAELSDALIEVGCYYWPSESETLRGWLTAVASRIRERPLRVGGRRIG